MSEPRAIRLQPSRPKWIAVLCLSFAFAVAGAFLIRAGEPVGWFLFFFYGYGFLVSVGHLLPRFAYLELSEQGFTICRPFPNRAEHIPWGHVSEFFVGGRPRRVRFDYSGKHAKRSWLRQLNKKQHGSEAALYDNYGLSSHDLVQLLNRWRVKPVGA